MHNHKLRQLTIAAGILICLTVFVSYRAQTFHYCAGPGDKNQSRIVANTETCGPNEQPVEWGDHWRECGIPSKIKMIGATIAAAFGIR